MTIYSKLLKLGYTDEDIRTAGDSRANTRQFTLAVADQNGGDPIVGLVYSADFRAEEEYGVGDLRKALGIDDYGVMSVKERGHVSRILGTDTLIISTTEMDQTVKVPEDGAEWSTLDELRAYTEWYDGALAHAQGLGTEFRYSRMDWLKVVELKAFATKYGISLKGLTRKADMLKKIVESDEYRTTATTPNVWPGWFHYGKRLILKADRGIVRDVISMLYAAGRENGTLAIGGGQSNPFGAGLSIYDGDDISKATFKERKAYIKWRNKAMKPIPAIIEKMEKEDGIRPYFLGKPSTGFKSLVGQGEVSEDTIFYWLNHSTITLSDGRRKQAYGWYSLAQLEAGEYKNAEKYS